MARSYIISPDVLIASVYTTHSKWLSPDMLIASVYATRGTYVAMPPLSVHDCQCAGDSRFTLLHHPCGSCQSHFVEENVLRCRN